VAGGAGRGVGDGGGGGGGGGPGPRARAAPPVLLGVRVAQPLVADRDPAREAGRAVDHDRAPVVALVEARELAEPRGAERLDLAPRGAQAVHAVLARAHAAETDEEHADLYPGARAVDERREHLVARLALLPDVAAEVDGPPRVPERLQEGGEELDAVVEEPGAAALADGHARVAGHRQQEVARLHGGRGRGPDLR